uniref:GPS domain-containing protein n=1 Tax=Knipowitschia caucasica TaxID=637954 RepID=A0AAV2K0Q0_KNICA
MNTFTPVPCVQEEVSDGLLVALENTQTALLQGLKPENSPIVIHQGDISLMVHREESDPGEKVQREGSDPGERVQREGSDPGQRVQREGSDPGERVQREGSDPGERVQREGSDPGKRVQREGSDPGERVQREGSDPGERVQREGSDPGKRVQREGSDPGERVQREGSDPGGDPDQVQSQTQIPDCPQSCPWFSLSSLPLELFEKDSMVDLQVVALQKNPFEWNSRGNVSAPIVSLKLGQNQARPIFLQNPLWNLLNSSVLDLSNFSTTVLHLPPPQSSPPLREPTLMVPSESVLPMKVYLGAEHPNETSHIAMTTLPHQGDTMDERYTWLLGPSELRGHSGPLFLLVRPLVGPGVKTINASLSITPVYTRCNFWNQSEREWSSAGCRVGPGTTPSHTQCLCDHLTFFGGSFFVTPNLVDPSRSAELFGSFTENPVVVCLVGALFLTYLLLLLWARRKDQQDTAKVKVTVLADNDPFHQYQYLVTVKTGHRRGASTTAQVTSSCPPPPHLLFTSSSLPQVTLVLVCSCASSSSSSSPPPLSLTSLWSWFALSPPPPLRTSSPPPLSLRSLWSWFALSPPPHLLLLTSSSLPQVTLVLVGALSSSSSPHLLTSSSLPEVTLVLVGALSSSSSPHLLTSSSLPQVTLVLVGALSSSSSPHLLTSSSLPQVTLVLVGSRASSSPHLLTDSQKPVFGRGATDRFILKTEDSLGEVQSVRLWHNNRGGDPDWSGLCAPLVSGLGCVLLRFVSSVMVQDLQTGSNVRVLCDSWIGLNIGDGALDRVFPTATEEELKRFRFVTCDNVTYDPVTYDHVTL